ncbi:MAG: hypothetical protein ACK5N8_02285 [Alphaproteobacteria bacterium]
MANIILLNKGLKANGEPQLDVEFKDLTAGDVMAAREQAEKAYFMPDGSVQVATSPNLAGKYILLKRIVRIGTISPVTEQHISMLSYEDYDHLVDAINIFDKASKEVEQQGRDYTSL